MHVYIYDSYLSQNKYSKILSQIETRITDLGLNGKISRLGLMKNVTDVVRSEIKRGAKTIVAVGNDDTVQQVIGSMANTDVPLGIIPIDKRGNSIADTLGIGLGEEACDILSARRIERLDLGRINDYYFLSYISVLNKGLIIDIEDKFSIEASSKNEIFLVNLPTTGMKAESVVDLDPKDGLLQLVIKEKQGKKLIFSNIASSSIFSFNKLRITGKENNPIIANENISLGPEAVVSIAPSALKIIVGKQRNF